LEIGLVLPPGHRLAGRSEIHFERLRNERWILPPRDANPVLYDELISCCHKAGFTPDVIAEMTQRPRVVAQVACGIGIATSEMFYFGLPGVGQGFQYGNEAKDCGN
jgi:DNA-binding transcriptional LysR family regulator